MERYLSMLCCQSIIRNATPTHQNKTITGSQVATAAIVSSHHRRERV